jgi:RNA polymerase sigma factor (sigma-70 family)
MPENEPPKPLINISTQWSLMFQAHHGQGDAAQEAQRQLLLRYCGAVYGYLLKAFRDPDAAAEQSQEFALRFVRGGFKRADPRRGRFRDFLRTVLYHLVVDYYRHRRAQPAPLPADSVFHPAAPEAASLDQEFLNQWRRELLARCWEALEADQEQGKHRYYAVLRWRAEHPDASAAQQAVELSQQQGRRFQRASQAEIAVREQTGAFVRIRRLVRYALQDGQRTAIIRHGMLFLPQERLDVPGQFMSLRDVLSHGRVCVVELLEALLAVGQGVFEQLLLQLTQPGDCGQPLAL